MGRTLTVAGHVLRPGWGGFWGQGALTALLGPRTFFAVISTGWATDARLEAPGPRVGRRSGAR
jgi:hypothetical protein